MADKSLLTIIFTAIGSLILPAMFGGFGGGTRYLHSVIIKKHVFKFSSFVMHIFIGTFAGLLIHMLMHETIGGSFSGIILLSGLLSVEIVTMIEKNGIPNRIKKFFE